MAPPGQYWGTPRGAHDDVPPAPGRSGATSVVLGQRGYPDRGPGPGGIGGGACAEGGSLSGGLSQRGGAVVQEPMTNPGFADRGSSFARGGLTQGLGSQVGGSTSWQSNYNERSFSSTAEPVMEPSPAGGAFSQGRAYSPRGQPQQLSSSGPGTFGGQCGTAASGPLAGNSYVVGSTATFGDRQSRTHSLNGRDAQQPPLQTTHAPPSSWQRDPARPPTSWGVQVQEPAAEPTPQRTHYDIQSRATSLGQPPPSWGAAKERNQDGYLARSEWSQQPLGQQHQEAPQRPQDQDLQMPDGCIEVSLSKGNTPGARFGFANVQSADSRSLLVTWVDNTGLLGLWNAQNPDNVVREGDAIINVNGVYGDSEAMRDKLQGDAVRMVVQPTGADKGAPRLTRA